ncbi:MAG TPA: hypothetical protein VGO64_02260, partial [Candidatus Limnocylindrales bacterium]|nr:hypothetical protein [Candidatus Limnocylindrales bacterium]
MSENQSDRKRPSSASGNGIPKNDTDGDADPFAGLTIDFGADAADVVALPGSAGNGGLATASGEEAGSVPFGGAIAFGAPLAAAERSRPAGPVGGPN